MLLDLGLPSALVGGIVLPLLGAVPDSAMIIASGVGKSREQANKEIAVGMGYVNNTDIAPPQTRGRRLFTCLCYACESSSECECDLREHRTSLGRSQAPSIP